MLGWGVVRLGCVGCLSVVIVTALLVGSAWFGFQMLQEPDFPATLTTAAEGARAQQKIFEVARRLSGRSGANGEPVVLSERELNAFLSRHLAEAAEARLSDVGLRLTEGGIAEFRGRIPLRHFVTEPPLSVLAGAVPAAWLDRPVWLRLGARARIEPGATRARRRYLRLEVVEFAVGRQWLPASLVRFLLDPAMLRVLRWPVPDGVEAITIEQGRVLIRPAS